MDGRRPRLPFRRTLHPDPKRKLDCLNGIAWGTMGVNGKEAHAPIYSLGDGGISELAVFIVH